MRKIRLFSAVLSLFLLVPASIIWAQSVSLTGVVYENSMVKIPLSTPKGDIKVYLPDNLTAGGHVHGKVVMEPKGKNEKQLAASLNYLQGLSIIPSISGGGPIITEPKKIVLDEATKKVISDLVFTIPENTELPLKLELADDKGKVHIKGEVQVIINPVFSISTNQTLANTMNPYLGSVLKKVITGNETLVLEPGNPSQVLKKFSAGNEKPELLLRKVPVGVGTDELANDAVTLPNLIPVEYRLIPWVSSSRQMVFVLPPQAAGAFDVLVKHNDGSLFFVDRTYVARLSIAIGKNNLRKDETTELSVSVTGLEMCPWPVQLEIENISENIVKLEKGNRQVYYLPTASSLPANLGVEKSNQSAFHSAQNVIGEKPGIFTVNVNLHVPAAACNNILQSQLNALKATEDINEWGQALKTDLQSYAAAQPRTAEGDRLRSFIRHLFENIKPVVEGETSQQARSRISGIISRINLPGDFMDNAQCTYMAHKVACKALTTAEGNPGILQRELIDKGLNYLENMASRTGNQRQAQEVQSAKEVMKNLPAGEKSNGMLAGLKNTLVKLNEENDDRNKFVHMEKGRDKSYQAPPGYKYIETGEHTKTMYVPGNLKHITEGKRESWLYPVSYTHVDTGFDKSEYISPEVRHISDDGPEKSNYVARHWVHWKTGPSKSYYFPKTIRHIDTGLHKSKVEYNVPGVDKPIREWEFQQKGNGLHKHSFPKQFIYARNTASQKNFNGLFFTNEKFIKNLQASQKRARIKKLYVQRTGELDIGNAKQVLTYVLDQLPEIIAIFPSENYYYFIFGHQNKLFKGSFSLFAHNRDEGIIDIGYSEVKENPFHNTQAGVAGGSGAVSAADGFSLKKRNDFAYELTYNGRKIIFNLHQPGLAPPKQAVLTADEVFAGPSFDESGLRFFLVYNTTIRRLYWLLNEDELVAEKFFRQGENLLIGRRTAFAFYDDKTHKRKILIGVKGENVLQNNWYDGPFDQLPDNYVYTGQLQLKEYLDQSYPAVAGRIDQYGHYTDEKGARVAVAPYLVYFSKEQLNERVKRCEKMTSAAARCACLTMQQYEVPEIFFAGKQR
jgi:hypothetical protein